MYYLVYYIDINYYGGAIMKSNAVNESLKFPLNTDFELEAAQLLEEDKTIVLAAVDLDHFMLVNDNGGHEEGDRVLIETGRYIEAFLNKLGHGKIFRYAGDEFMILFADGEEKEDVFLWMEELRRNYPIKTDANPTLSLTIGISESPEDGATVVELVRKADGAMYRGKMNGRSRVALAREEKMVTKTSHYTEQQLKRLTKLSKKESIGEAVLLREALDMLLNKYDV
ncbi:MAG: diguanylate cyclase [Clostridiales bacterium]|nr:diguanylate cyclase [Clostridiales bacterium]